MDSHTKTALQRLAQRLSRRQGKDANALARRLNEVVARGEVKAGEFTMADVNIIQSVINTQEFTAQVMEEIAQERGLAAASTEAAKARELADVLRKYQAAVPQLGVTL